MWVINFPAAEWNTLVCSCPCVLPPPGESVAAGDMVAHVLLAFRKHAGFKNEEQKRFVGLSF